MVSMSDAIDRVKLNSPEIFTDPYWYRDLDYHEYLSFLKMYKIELFDTSQNRLRYVSMNKIRHI